MYITCLQGVSCICIYCQELHKNWKFLQKQPDYEFCHLTTGCKNCTQTRFSHLIGRLQVVPNFDRRQTVKQAAKYMSCARLGGHVMRGERQKLGSHFRCSPHITFPPSFTWTMYFACSLIFMVCPLSKLGTTHSLPNWIQPARKKKFFKNLNHFPFLSNFLQTELIFTQNYSVMIKDSLQVAKQKHK